MAKDKARGASSNKHLRARVAYLHHAAVYLTGRASPGPVSEQVPTSSGPTHESKNIIPGPTSPIDNHEQGAAAKIQPCAKSAIATLKLEQAPMRARAPTVPLSLGPATRLSSHLTQVARKAQIRLDRSIKHQICKSCSTVLIDGSTCTKYIENLSKGGKKAHANISVIECRVCGTRKRHPVAEKRKSKRSARLS